MEAVSNRIKQFMEICDVKQIDISQKTGIPKSAVSQYLSGKCIPKRDKLQKIAEAFEINVDWLQGQDVPMKQRLKRVDFSSPHIMNDDEIYAMEEAEDELIKLELSEKIAVMTPVQRWELNERIEDLATLDDEDWKLLISFNQLNAVGKALLQRYARDLNKISEYYEE